jgi:hypothetical protein
MLESAYVRTKYEVYNQSQSNDCQPTAGGTRLRRDLKRFA